MDYSEAFRNLKTNKKYSRKSPHKAVLLLSVINLVEQGKLIDNEIKYDDVLKNEFLLVWEQLLPYEKRFLPEVYLPYWYLESEDFWHIVPIRGKEDVVNMMRDCHIKPSESKINNSVDYAELDEDLYFLMTISVGRSQLRDSLISTYFDLSEEEKLHFNNNCEPASSNMEVLGINGTQMEEEKKTSISPEKTVSFESLSLDIRICINFEYFSYLKNNQFERDSFLNNFPDVQSLYHRIVQNPLRRNELSSSFEFEYSNFLRDLKISLMSEDGALDFVDSIDHALDVLENDTPDDVEDSDYQEESYSEVDDSAAQIEEGFSEDSAVETVYVETPSESYRKRNEYNLLSTCQPEQNSDSYNFDSLPELPDAKENRKGKPWTNDEEVTVKFYYEKGYSFDDIARAMGRTVVSIKSRLGSLGVIEFDYEKEYHEYAQQKIEEAVATDLAGDDFFIENSSYRCCIFNKENQKIYTSSGKLKLFSGKPYRIAYSYSRLTINTLDRDIEKFITGRRIVNAASRSALFLAVNEYDYLDAIEDITCDYRGYLVCVSGIWYDSDGNLVDKGVIQAKTNVISSFIDDNVSSTYLPKDSDTLGVLDEKDFNYEPKGKLKKIAEDAESSYEILWIMAIVDLQLYTNRQSNFTLDEIACMMVANAWELMNLIPDAKDKEESLNACVEYLIEESKEYMDKELTLNTPKEEIYAAIKDYPMAGAFEDAVEELVETAPMKVLKLWYPNLSDDWEIEVSSQTFSVPCLYAFYNKRIDPYIVVNQKWQNNLYYEHNNIVKYFAIKYKNFLDRL